MNNKKDILSMSLDKLKVDLDNMKQPKFRAGQIFTWLHEKDVRSFDEMTNLSNDLREEFKNNYFIDNLVIEKKSVSKKDGTIKYLFKLSDGEFVETVLMRYSYGNSVCISTQVGCKMGCTFCASTIAGFKRNLTAAEMLLQVYLVQKDINDRVSNVVLMGIGEPLDNFSNVIDFLYLINDKQGKNLSMRNITLSTCGIIENIEKLQEYNLGLTLAISLHAPNQRIRKQTMPISIVNKYADLIRAGKKYSNQTKRRVSYEYALIDGLNDSKNDARELAGHLKGSLSHVNLITINEVKGVKYKRSEKDKTFEFKEILSSFGISVTKRRTLGADIEAACGQLRRDRIE